MVATIVTGRLEESDYASHLHSGLLPMNGRELSSSCCSIRDWCPFRTVPVQLALFALSFVACASGCQVSNDRGLVRAWADANSIGGPAAFVDQMRTDSFRTAPPANVLPRIKMTELPRDSWSAASQEVSVIPMVEPFRDAAGFAGEFSPRPDDTACQPPDSACQFDEPTPLSGDLQRMSYSDQQPRRRFSGSQNGTTGQAVTPVGAWLF